MKHRLPAITALFVCAGLAATGYLIAPAPGAQVGWLSGERRGLIDPVAPPVPMAKATAVFAAKAPVPLLLSPRTAVAVAVEVAVVPIAEDENVTDSAAKAMIETDGYKSVRNLLRGTDGVWRGRARRGDVEVAVSVDGEGNVSSQ